MIRLCFLVAINERVPTFFSHLRCPFCLCWELDFLPRYICICISWVCCLGLGLGIGTGALRRWVFGRGIRKHSQAVATAESWQLIEHSPPFSFFFFAFFAEPFRTLDVRHSAFEDWLSLNLAFKSHRKRKLARTSLSLPLSLALFPLGIT